MTNRGLSSPARVIDAIIAGATCQESLKRVGAELGLTPDQAAARARACLHEMVAMQEMPVVRGFQWVMSPLHVYAWDRQADASGLARLRELNRAHSLVFLPCHRSYADPFVLGAVLREAGFPPNYFLPGANVAFWPLGDVFHRVGGVTIRRRIGDDPIYKLALREYFAHLAAACANLEWYIEGGRSRTGKLRPPRYGLLRYLVDAIATGRADDALLVPVSITYDQLPELGVMAAEDLGTAKTPEGIPWLLGYFRQQRRHAGTAHIRFGEPLSLLAGLALTGKASGGDTRLAVERIAFEVCDRINNATPVLPNALVALALLGVGGRALTLEQVVRLVAPLREYAERRALPAVKLEALGRPEAVAKILDQLERAGVLSVFRQGDAPVYSIPPGQHNIAAFYRNSAIHWFVNRAIVELAILRAAERGDGDLREAAWQEALRLRDLQKFEFFFARKQVFLEQVIGETELIDPRWQDHCTTPEGARGMLAKARFLVAHRVLRSFLESYLIVADRLVALEPGVPMKESEFLTRCVGVGRQYQLQGRVADPAAVSREVFANALKLAANRGLFGDERGAEDLAAGRRALLAELETTLRRVAVIDAIDSRRMESFHDHA